MKSFCQMVRPFLVSEALHKCGVIGLSLSIFAMGGCTNSLSNPVSDIGVETRHQDIEVSELSYSDTNQAVDAQIQDLQVESIEDSMDPIATTYHGSVRPLIEKNCRGCHSSGGFAPFPFEEYEEVKESASLILNSVTTGRMPPWMPELDCHPIRDVRALAQEDIDTFVLWVEEGAPEGDPAEYIEPESPPKIDLSGASVVIEPEGSYVPNAEEPDDLRCFPLSKVFEEDTYLLASEILPGRTDWVHHAVIYRVSGDDFGLVELIDEKSEASGYSCFGGPGVPDYDLVGGWVPGAGPMVAPEGSAMKVDAGSRLVLEIHYSGHASEGAPLAGSDLTRVQLWSFPQGEIPEQFMLFTEFMHLDLDIKAHDPGSVQEALFTVEAPATLVAVAPHMHFLGSGFLFELVLPDESNKCLIEIDEWDFWWQQFFHYPVDAYVTLEAGDQVRLRCIYDNTVSNQPVVNGVQRDPRDVRWGESSVDEMCIANMILLVPNPEFSGP